MIVAPLAYPILGLGLGIAGRSWQLFSRSLAIVAAAFAIAFTLAILITIVFGSIRVDNTFISFTSNRYLATGIAIIAGAIAAYGLLRPKVSNAITGVAIAVSLMPPLVATGIELTSNKPTLAGEAFMLFSLNVAGILVASTFVFIVLHIGQEYRLRKD
jgi:uncharacterized hydrophobic protein (TIGR00271 family)